MTARSSRNAIGPPHGRATIQVGIAVVGATFMPEEPDVVVMPAVTVSVVIVLATVITSVAPSVFINVLSLSSVSSTCLLVDAVFAVALLCSAAHHCCCNFVSSMILCLLRCLQSNTRCGNNHQEESRTLKFRQGRRVSEKQSWSVRRWEVALRI